MLTSWELGLTPDQMREVDRLAEADYGIAPVQLMEVAGLQVARVVREMIGPSLAGRAVCILAGKGNNGGDGLVAGRRLAGWGARVEACTTFELAGATGLSEQQLRAAVAAGVEVAIWNGELPGADLYVDALLGSGASGTPRRAVAEVISAAPAGQTVLALDVPSGLDALTGETPGPCVTAGTTVTLAAPKTGLLAPGARRYTGRLLVADIGIPAALLRGVGVDPAGLFGIADLMTLS